MTTIWIVILTLAANGQIIDLEFSSPTEDDCWNARAAIMETVQADGAKYDYWYIDACRKDSTR